MQFKHGLLTLLFAGLLWTGCDDDSATNPNTEMGKFKVHMTDAPARFEAVNVTFTEISANKNGEWITVNNTTQTINLLELNNGKSIVVGDAEIPEGQYSQVRLKIDGATVVKDGQTHTVDVSSEAQNGFDINTTFEIDDDDTYDLLIDFDAHRSVVSTDTSQGTTSNTFRLNPTVRAVPLAITGSITGKVSTTANAPLAFAIAGSDTITTTAVDTTSGEFTLAFLPPGTYFVAVQDSTGATTSTSSNISISTGSQEDLGTLNLQVGIVSQ